MVRWPLPRAGSVDLSLVDDLARLQLHAGRAGWRLALDRPPAPLVELLALVGLPLEVLGQSEGGEQLRVEEVVVPDDPVP